MRMRDLNRCARPDQPAAFFVESCTQDAEVVERKIVNLDRFIPEKHHFNRKAGGIKPLGNDLTVNVLHLFLGKVY